MKQLPGVLHAACNGAWPDTGVVCCMGSAVYGPARCTCWEPIYAEGQEAPDVTVPTVVRPRLCHDCAYRPGSPERTDVPDAAADHEDLDRIAADGTPFYCHQGMRQPVAFAHPSGAIVVASPLRYDPARADRRTFDRDGDPSMLCAGWDARRRALTGAR